MFERYTEASREVIFAARDIALELRSSYIRSEHLLYGFAGKNPELLEAFVSKPLGVANAIQKQIRDSAGNVDLKIPVLGSLPLDNPVKRILAYTAEEADRLTSLDITPRHLLLGILREENALGAKILREHGVSFLVVRASASSIVCPPVTPLFVNAESRPILMDAAQNAKGRAVGMKDLLTALLRDRAAREILKRHGTRVEELVGLLQRPTLEAESGSLLEARHE